MSEITDAIDVLEPLVPELEDPATRFDAARPFVDTFYTLYAAAQDGPEPGDREALEAFLAGSAPRLEEAMGFLDYHLSDRIEEGAATAFEDREWLQLCRLRSTLEALKELYAPHLPMAELIPEDEELDATLRAKGEAEAFQDPDETPVSFPATHWWWGME